VVGPQVHGLYVGSRSLSPKMVRTLNRIDNRNDIVYKAAKDRSDRCPADSRLKRTAEALRYWRRVLPVVSREGEAISPFPDQDEVLLPANTRFQINSFVLYKKGKADKSGFGSHPAGTSPVVVIRATLLPSGDKA